jgi:DEAD/DEAH box helicase domain-containing protein
MDPAPVSSARPDASAGASGHDFLRFLGRLTADRRYADQIAHVEHLPEREARHAELDPPLSKTLAEALDTLGIRRLYTHQVEAISAARGGANVVTVTGTASGKTVAFLVPILEALERDPKATALLLYPTKALAQDQLKGLTRLAESHPRLGEILRAGTYDGDTSQSARRKIRDEANLILTNPDMLHRGILPYHAKWHRVFRNLRHVVVDEVHTYRGIFGSNVGNVLRRLRRVAGHYESSPVFLCSSATIRNPLELAETLAGMPFTLVDDDGSPRGPKTFVLWNPPYLDGARMERRSGNVEAKELFVKLAEDGVNTIVFTKARVVTELIYKYAREDLLHRRGHLADRIKPYRGGYLPAERREIERQLFSGDLLGVVATNALELGIDIGGLDAAVLVGFPGTVASIWQQAGRAGRSRDEAVTFFVGYNDPIDQYLLRHPRYFFAQNPEAAVCDPENPYVLAGHLGCAAFELPLTERDRELFGPGLGPIREILRDEGELHPVEDEDYWSSTEFPSKRVNLRTISDDTYTIVDTDNEDSVIGTVDAISAPELVYPEAIYLHEGEMFFVHELDLEKRIARVKRVSVDYYTQPVLDTSIRVTGERERRDEGAETLVLNEATVTWATTMFKKIKFGNMDSIGYKNLDLPPQHLDTVALGWSPSAAMAAALKREGLKPVEGLLGVRNLAITVFPVLAMCDRADVGGVIDSSNTGRPTLYLYDRFPGGLGFAERAYAEFPRLVTEALSVLKACDCPEGCPSCVGLPILRPAIHQDPDVGMGYPIPDKRAARLLLEALAG